MQVVIGYTYIVANGSSCCFFIRLSQHGRFHAVSFETASRDAQTFNYLDWSRNVNKFYAWQVVSLMNEHGRPKFVAIADPLSTIRNSKLIAQGEKLETSAKLRVFVSMYEMRVFLSRISLPLEQHVHILFFFVVHVGVLHVFKEIWKWF